MTRVVIRQVTETPPRGYFIQWTIVGLPQNAPSVFTFDLEKSGNETGPWKPVATGLSQFAFFDAIPQEGDPEVNVRENQFRLFSALYYRITSHGDYEGSDVFEVGPVARGKMSGYQRKKARDNRILLKSYTGNPAALLKRRVWGARCPKCFDKKTQAATRGNCGTCFGTSFTDGYWAPIPLMARRQLREEGGFNAPPKGDGNLVAITIPSTPQIDDGDVVVFFGDGRRFVIDGYHAPLIQLEPTVQTANAKEIQHSDVVYSIRVDQRSLHPLY